MSENNESATQNADVTFQLRAIGPGQGRWN